MQGSIIAQNTDAPYNLSHFNGQPALWGYTININYNDSTVFAHSWDKFMLGWQWTTSIPSVINKRLYTNVQPAAFHGWLQESFAACPVNQPMNWNWTSRISYNGWAASSLEWHPAAPVYDTLELFQPIPNDTIGAIFGFRNKPYGRLQLQSTQPNFMHIILEDSTSYTYPVLAFSKPMYKNSIRLVRNNNDTTIQSGTNLADSLTKGAYINGNRWYVSAHLKRSTNNYNQVDNDTVLTIKVTWYKYPNELNQVFASAFKFDSLPNQSSIVTYSRGKMDKNLVSVTGDTVFAIRRNMIPQYSTNPDSAYVTLSAFFKCFDHRDSINLSKNPFFAQSNGFRWNENEHDIDSIDIQVKYHGKCDIALDWIRLETPFARAMYRGTMDSMFAAWFSDDLRGFKTEQQQIQNQNKFVRILNIQAIDEVDAYPRYWRYHKYLSTLFDNRLITESGGGYPPYKHIVKQQAYWIGLGSHFSAGFKNPIKPRSFYTVLPSDTADNNNHGIVKKFWLDRDNGWYNPFNDSLNYTRNLTCYECTDNGFGFPDSVSGHSIHPPNPLIWSNNWWNALCAFEGGPYYVASKYTDLIYGSKPWYDYVPTHCGYTYGLQRNQNPNNTSQYDTLPMVTANIPYWGESLRFNLWYVMLLGCKGFLYDGYSYAETYSTQQMKDSSALSGFRTFDNRGVGATTTIFQGSLLKSSPSYSKVIGGFPDTVGTATLLDYKSGPDYYTTKTDSLNPSGYHQFFSNHFATPYVGTTKYIDTVYKTFYMKNSIPSNVTPSVYFGMLTDRYIMMKMHDFVKHNETELLNMELLAYSGKGFNYTHSCRNNDTTLYKKIFDMTWGGVKTKEIGSSQNEEWAVKSTFVDVMLHKSKSLNIDSVCYVGIVNRRLNPLRDLVTNGTLPPTTPIKDRFEFLSTISFDSLVQSGTIGKYSQVDAREITIPFNYRHPDTKTRLLHIQELTSDSTVKGIDTVICQSCTLSAKYLPGEGKLFRVTIVKPLDRFADRGSLDFVNQHKLIAMPNLIGVDSVNRKPIYDTNHVRYHFVFHRIDTIPDGPFGFMVVPRVYYKRSKLIERCAPYDVTNPLLTGMNDVWERTILLSDTIEIKNLFIPNTYDTISPCPCKYPSVVVRFDTIDLKEYVYCVFSCQKNDGYNKLLIVESQFNSDSTNRRSQEINHADSSNIELYGHPVINASQHRNYYAFSAYLSGINYGTRFPDTTRRSLFDWRTVSVYSRRDMYSTTIADCRHPSLNTYSNLSNDDECALVWQEQNVGVTTSVWDEWHVYYTRLRTDTINVATHYLPSIKVGQNGHNIDTLDGRKARISVMPLAAQAFHYFKMPSVFRMSFPSGDNKYLRSDKIVFQGDSSIPCTGFIANRTGIFLSNISSIYSYPSDPDSLSSAYGGTIFSCTTTLNNPSGVHAMNRYFNGTVPLTDSSFVLNFDLPEYGWLAHITQGYFNWGSPIQYIENAEHAQLSHQPFLTEDYYWTFVRRIQTVPSDALNKSMFASAEHLLKRTKPNEPSHYILSGFQLGSSRFALADILSPHNESTFRKGKQRNNERTVLKDSTASNWFSVYQNKLIQFVLADNDYDIVSLNIENKRTGMRVPIDIRSLAPQDGKKVRAGRIALRNGGGDEYRFVMGKTNEQAQYYEDVYIGDVPELLGKSTTENDYVVDVSQTLLSKESTQLFVYPNPANKELLIRFEGMTEDIAERNFDYVLEFTDALGKTIQKRSIKAMETTTLDIQDYAEGIYYVRVRGSIQTINSPVTILR